IVFHASFFANSDERSEVPAPVSKMKSNGPRSLIWTGTKISGCAPPARRNFARARLAKGVVAVIRATSVRPYVTIAIYCLREIVEARRTELRRNSVRNEDRRPYKSTWSGSRKAAYRQIV